MSERLHEQTPVLRFSIVHCVADARPVALLVVAPASVNIQSDQWVQIDGELSSRAREGDRLVTIVARRITPVAEPNSRICLPPTESKS